MTDDAFDVEYAVQMKCDSCSEDIINKLSNLEDVKIVNISVKEQSLLLKLGQKAPSAIEIQELIEKNLGLNTIIRGAGDFITAVSELHGSDQFPQVRGVARFTQNETKQCLLDAVIDNLDNTIPYTLGVHEYGDLSKPDYSSIGSKIFSFSSDSLYSKSSRLTTKIRVNDCDLSSFIGRSFAILTLNSVVAAGIVARASRVRDNTKKICDCTGKTLWQERNDQQKKADN